jgi:hypothetical protein
MMMADLKIEGDGDEVIHSQKVRVRVTHVVRVLTGRTEHGDTKPKEDNLTKYLYQNWASKP